MPPPGMRRPLTKNDGVEFTPSDAPSATSVFTSRIAFSYCASKSPILPVSDAMRRTVVGLSSSWWRKNQSLSASEVPFDLDIVYAAAASHEATNAADPTFALQVELSG